MTRVSTKMKRKHEVAIYENKRARGRHKGKGYTIATMFMSKLEKMNEVLGCPKSFYNRIFQSLRSPQFFLCAQSFVLVQSSGKRENIEPKYANNSFTFHLCKI